MLQSQKKTLSKLKISAHEVTFLEDIEDIGFGELYDVSLVDEPNIIEMELSPRQRSFIVTLRREKFFDKVMIHDSSPQYAVQVGMTNNGRECQFKFKF